MGTSQRERMFADSGVSSAVTDTVDDVLAPTPIDPPPGGQLHWPPERRGCRPGRLRRRRGREEHGPTGILKWLTSTDHKVIGKSYTITSLVFFCMAGLHGHGHANPAGVARQHARHPAPLQRAVHDARQLDAVPVRRALCLRWPRQLHRAAAVRRARHGLPPSERPQLLAVPRRRDRSW